MAGVLFIIYVPCEQYEKILLKRLYQAAPIQPTTRKVHQHIAASSSDEEINYYLNSKVRNEDNLKEKYLYNHRQESRHSSLETFAISIESDSLNCGDKKDNVTDKKKPLVQTKSADDLTAVKVRNTQRHFNY